MHDCVYAKTLDNITAVMIAFDNFEKVTRQFSEKYPTNQGMKEYEAMLAQKRLVEPVTEEYIQNEPDTPVAFPKMKETASHHSN